MQSVLIIQCFICKVSLVANCIWVCFANLGCDPHARASAVLSFAVPALSSLQPRHQEVPEDHHERQRQVALLVATHQHGGQRALFGHHARADGTRSNAELEALASPVGKYQGGCASGDLTASIRRLPLALLTLHHHRRR